MHMNSFKYIFSYLSIICLSLLILSSCSKQEYDNNLYHEYFGLSEGSYVDYNVMEVNHDVNAAISHDTSIYQLRTLISDTIIDNIGRTCRKFVRFRKDSIGADWVVSDIWTAIIDSRRGELVEENLRLIKMGFPVHIETKWKENAFNINASDYAPEFSYTRIHSPLEFNGINYDSTAHIEKKGNLSYVDYNIHKEIYAKNIGLISKYYKDLKINIGDTLNITSGKELIYECIGYGVQ